VRYLGNKTKLLPAIESLLAARGVRPGALVLDVFTGTASVARRMKALGYRVAANDLMACAVVNARATVGLRGPPRFAKLLGRAPLRKFLASSAAREALASDGDRATLPLRAALAFLERRAEPREGLIFRQYSDGGPAGRCFFRGEIGRAIDGVHACLEKWQRERWIDESERCVLLASLVDGADRVANISGTYGAFLKSWQPNARGPLELRPPPIVPGPAARVFRRDGNELVRRFACDVLYVDPPYNRRQYAKNYHVLEVIAELSDVRDRERYEAEIYGKTGLRPMDDRVSDYCLGDARSGTSPCARAFAALVKDARAEHLVVSYNEEGILSLDEITAALEAACGDGFRRERDHLVLSTKRFRSDADRGAARTYRVLEGHAKDEVREWLFYGRKNGALARAGRRSA
jgi:adenine-specific DNA-methyltransferase